MKQLMAALRTTAVLVVLFAVSGLYNKHPGGGDGEAPKRPKFSPGMMPKKVGAAQQQGIKKAQEGRPKGAETGEDATPAKPKNQWEDPDFADAMYDMHRFGQMGDGTMDKTWDGDGLGNGAHKPDSTVPGKTKFPPGTTKAEVEGWFKDIAANPDSRPQPRPHGDGWVLTGTRNGITMVVTLDKDGSISGGHPVSGPGVETNPRAN
ncbi:hypothetical protein Afil01_25810 [Actinorhabdospora filicis]|uniref:EndoU nuclease n=1 Tax=Actinorhabdospora filicis TaxID=1785913 RepID=A0A9W6SIM6_9ACTN|nr:hypothetical protein [Actinorhabdospora filicis]GLZ77774.1 hypothetical protein Afil01_25810 [Actinorhabdospora filicis]